MGKLTKLPRRKLSLNTIYCADNLEVMKQLPGDSIDLIYIDPPFCTQAVWKDKAWDEQVQVGKFDDRWGGGLHSYVAWMRPRLQEMHRLLKASGSLFVHVDYRAVHYLKVELDKIFGMGRIDIGTKHLVNEIIWWYSGGASAKANFSRKHHNILWYAKNKKKYVFNADSVRIPYEGKGGYQNSNGILNNGKRYFPNPLGKIPNDVWKIPIIHPNDTSERLGYPTQKPLTLLKRIIEVASNKNDIVADFFCGCGTTISAAHALGRNWIGVDASQTASSVIRKRMQKEHDLSVDVTPLKSLTKAQILSMNHSQFEDYVVRCVGGIPNENKVRDGGIDGRLLDGTPIQVKQSDRIGTPIIDNFYKHLEHNGRGIIIAKSFTKTARNEVSKLLNEKGWELILMTVDDVIRDYYNESA